MKTGVLRLRSDGRYEIIDSKGQYITYLTCGDSVQIYKDNKWIKGRIEYDNRYYFLSDDNIKFNIYENDKAKVE